jgi:mannose-6-phosphate isomerase-like protein (cupin superfamily)
MSNANWIAHQAEGMRLLQSAPDDDRTAYLIRHGTMRAGLYAPRGFDPQTPHDRDELYIIAEGQAGFVRQQERITVRAGDVVFVGAGDDHRFEEMSPDFLTWVVFWGEIGGEGRG